MDTHGYKKNLRVIFKHIPTDNGQVLSMGFPEVS